MLWYAQISLFTLLDQDYVASDLAFQFPSGSFECPNSFLPGDIAEPAHTDTRTGEVGE